MNQQTTHFFNIPHFNVLVCTPGDLIYSNYAHCLLSTFRHLSSLGITYNWVNSYSAHVAQARDVIINGGWSGNGGYQYIRSPEDYASWRIFDNQYTYDQIVWIDNDISWTIEDFMKLLSHQEEVVAGAYLLADGKNLCVSLADRDIQSADRLDIPTLNSLNQSKLYEVYTCGMGFMKVRQGVIERMPHPIFHLSMVHLPLIRNQNKEMIDYWNVEEDASFCSRVYEVGSTVYFDPSIRVGHFKKSILTIPDP